MKVGIIITAVCLLFIFIAGNPFGGHSSEPRIQTESVAKIKNAYNLLTAYASDHAGTYPAAYDMDFLNVCLAAGYITEQEIDDYRANGAKDGTTGYALTPNLHQTSRGSRILLITTKPVTEDMFTAVAVNGKAECLPVDEALGRLTATLADESWEPRDFED